MAARLSSIIVAFSIVFFSNIASKATPMRDIVGWYFDSQATQRCAEQSPFQVVTAYLCITNATTELISGWELEAEISGNAIITRWDVAGSEINLRNPPEFIVGLGGINALPITNNKVILCEADVFLFDDNPVELYVKPLVDGSILNTMYYISDVGINNTLVPSSGSVNNPTAWINANIWPCVSTNRGKEFDVYVKTTEGAIDITNASGGDLVGNITIQSNSLDSLVTEFEVEEIHKVTDGFPDSLAYYVRVTNEPRMSTVCRDLFVFSFSDSANCRLFVESDSCCSSILWSVQPAHASCDYDPEDTYLGYHIVDSGSGITTNVLKAWDVVRSGTIPVAIIDSGIEDNKDNIDFYGRVLGDIGYYDDLEDYSHGTQVGGLIGAVQDNDYGTTGMCQVKLYNVKYHWDNEDQLDFAQALQRLMNTQIAIANFSGGWQSFGGNIFDAETGVRNICDEFYNSNRMLFAAAGNNTMSPTKSPARYSSVCSISGIDEFGSQYDNSNFGKVDFTAPAENVRVSTTIQEGNNINENTMEVSGTSYSTPIAAGVASLLLSYNPSLFNDDIYNIMKLSARVDLLSEPQHGSIAEAYGHGLVQAWDALELLLTNAMISSKEYGYSRYTESNLGSRMVFNVPRIGDGRYYVYRYKVEKDITYPSPFTQMPYVWGRGVDTFGICYLHSNPMEVIHKRNCDVLSGSETVYGCTLVTYVYKFVNIFDYSVTWYPNTLNNACFGYAALGKDGVVAVSEEYQNNNDFCIAPNPFNISTAISFYNDKANAAVVSVYDAMGHLVNTLYNGQLPEGRHSFIWNGRNNEGGICASAVYFIRFTVNGISTTKAMTLLK